jgi:hypothetical protein
MLGLEGLEDNEKVAKSGGYEYTFPDVDIHKNYAQTLRWKLEVQHQGIDDIDWTDRPCPFRENVTMVLDFAVSHSIS